MYPQNSYKFLNIKVRNPDITESDHMPITCPIYIGEYTLSPHGHFDNSNSGIRYIPQHPLTALKCSVNQSNEVVPQNEEIDYDSVHMDNMFQFLAIDNRIQSLSYMDIICSIDLLQLIMRSPIEYNISWSIVASKYHNTIYMCELRNSKLESTFNISRLQNEINKSRLKKFYSTYLTSRDPKLLDNNEDQEGEDAQGFAVFRSKIGGLQVLYDAPVIGEFIANDPLLYHFTELQLRLKNMNQAEYTNHLRSDALNWWLKCTLIGINSLYVAHHDENAEVKHIQKVAISSLVEDASQRHFWRPMECCSFLSTFLRKIKNVMESVDNPSTVYCFEYEARNEAITYQVREGRNIHTFIPDWYRSKCGDSLDYLKAMNNLRDF